MGHPQWALPGRAHSRRPPRGVARRGLFPSLGEQEPLFAELESFLADVVAGTHPEIEPDRVLATVLFSDIVG